MFQFLQRILQEIMKKNNTWNIRCLVDEQPSVLYWRLSDFTVHIAQHNLTNKPVKSSLAKQPTKLTVQLYRLWAVACETYDPNAFSPCLLPQDSIPAYHQLYLFSCGIYGAIIQISRELRIFCKCLRDWSFILWPCSFLANWQNLAKEP